MDSAIRTEADLRERLEAQRAEHEALFIGLGIAELSALGFGSVTLHDWSVAGRWVTDGYCYTTYRIGSADDPHTTEFPAPEAVGGGTEHRCHIDGNGPTPTQAMASLLSEARTKAAPK